MNGITSSAASHKLYGILGIGKSTGARAAKKLKDYGIIKRIGSTKAGYWKVPD